jgi:hypothetical protein
MIATLSLAYRHDEDPAVEGVAPSVSAGSGDSGNDPALRERGGAIPRAVAAPGQSSHRLSASDPALVKPAIASPQQMQQARDLREQIKQRYLNRETPPVAFWSVDID